MVSLLCGPYASFVEIAPVEASWTRRTLRGCDIRQGQRLAVMSRPLAIRAIVTASD
jgi:hypothetical protein